MVTPHLDLLAFWLTRTLVALAPVELPRLDTVRVDWQSSDRGDRLAAGLPAAFAATGVTRAFLFGVSPTAPHVFLLASLLLAAATVAATLLPARRASRIDPIVALRE